MRVVSTYIKIGDYEFDFVNEFSVETAWGNLTDKATITLPRNLKFPEGDWNKSIPRGTQVLIKSGYDNQLNEVFSGYVVRLKPAVPMVIECEDEMWKLKQIEINDTCSNEDLKTFLERVLNIQVDAFEIRVGRFVCNKINGAQLLDKIKSEFGLYSFFRNGKLIVGKEYDQVAAEHNVIIDDNIASEDLEYSLKEDFKMKVTAISTFPDGSKIEKEFGDDDGDSKTLNFFDVKEADLEALAKKELERMKYDGYKGGLTLFGEPFVRFGDVMKITDPKESDKKGKYFIDAVTYTGGVNGIRQDCKLGRRAS